MRHLMTASVALLLAACTAGPMKTGDDVPPPNGYIAYCQREADACAIPLTPTVQAKLNAVHAGTLATFEPVAEPEGEDLWQPGLIGDCEDFALLEQQTLRALYPAFARAFRLATAYTEDGALHAVLTVETLSGTLVCDMLFPTCMHWKEFPYSFVARESDITWQQVLP